MKDPVLARLSEIIAELFDVDPHSISPGTEAKEVPGWDSVGHLSLCGALEESFEIRFDVGELAEMNSVDGIVSRIKAKSTRWREMTVTTS